MIIIIIIGIFCLIMIIVQPIVVHRRINKEIATFRHYEPGYAYVYVEEDGSVRELHEEEKEYLEALFHPVDGPRPYKYSYDQLTADKKMCGYIERVQIPRTIEIKPLKG